MTIVSDILYLALKDSGAFGQGQQPSPEDVNDALRRADMMISQWTQRRWLVYHLVDTGFACTGALSYSVGPGQNFSIPRPDRIEGAYIRQAVSGSPSPIDWPLQIIEAREDYIRIAIKTLAAAPSEYVFYDSDFPYGALFPWPLPNSPYELHILTKAVLQSFAAVGDTILLPPEYEEAIYANLMLRFRIAYRLPADPAINRLAKATLRTIRGSNFQIGTLRLPSPITRGPAYNIFSDRGGN